MHIDGNRDPELCLDRVLRSAEEDFDTKMLLDPFEKQLDPPPAAIQLGDGDCWQRKVVGEEHQSLAGLRILESDAARWRIEVLARVETSQHDGLIANQPVLRSPRDLREHQLAQVHRRPLRVSSSQDRKSMRCTSNRDQEKT